MRFFSARGRQYVQRGRLVKVCELTAAWYEAIDDPECLVESLQQSGHAPDLFTFFQRVPHVEPRYPYYREPYSVSVIRLTTYEDWFNREIGKKTRQMIKKSRKECVEVRMVDFDDEYVRGISDIYNETPIRQGRRFPHYRDRLEKVREENSTYLERSIYLGAYWENELIGFSRIVLEREFADILQLLSKTLHREKGVTNALLAKSVEICSQRNAGYLAYGDWESSGLGDFKRHNGFTRMDLPRYYIPLNEWGALALRLGLHRRTSSMLPDGVVVMLKALRKRWLERRVKNAE